MNNTNSIQIDKQRLWSSVMSLGDIGETEEGAMMRVTGSEADSRARDTVISWFEDAGMSVTVDAVGNIRARRAGQKDAPPIVTGSHIDTVPKGGKFDGTVGVLTPLEIVRAWNDAGFDPNRPLDIVVFTEEEGTRFGVGLLGSLVATGKLNLAEALALEDNSTTLKKRLETIGYNGSGIIDLTDAAAFLELHVEQGPILDDNEADIGIVEAIAGITHHRVTLHGTADHAGNTPMDVREDAHLGASEFSLDVEQIAVQHGDHSVGTVGKVNVSPNGTNVVPGRVELGVDIRDTDADRLANMVAAAKESVQSVAAERNLDSEWETLLDVEPTEMSGQVSQALEEAAKRRGYRYEMMLSGAGHDAMNVADVLPTGMLFVPSEDGVSHSPDEYTSPEDLFKGAEVLETVVRNLAQATDETT